MAVLYLHLRLTLLLTLVLLPTPCVHDGALAACRPSQHWLAKTLSQVGLAVADCILYICGGCPYRSSGTRRPGAHTGAVRAPV